MIENFPTPPPASTPFEAWLIAAVTRIDAGHEALHAELLGNGQPGRVQRIEAAITDNKRDCEKRDSETEEKIASLNKRVWFSAGSNFAILTILKIFTTFFGH